MKNVLKALLIIFVVIIGILAYPTISYLLWQKQFQAKMPEMSCSSNTSDIMTLDDKFKKFVLSEEDVTFIELSPDEVLSLLMNTNIISGGEVEGICIEPNSGIWNIFAKVSLQGVNLPWIRVDIAKDTMETAQLYVANIYVGNILVRENMAKGLKEQLNRGISDALILVNENSFLGRKIQNIELLNNKMVVKGTL
jgi:hypothetical protein